MVAEVLEAFIKLFAHELKAKRYSYSFTAAVSYLFIYDSMLHRLHYRIPDEELRKLRTVNELWRKDIKVGDKVDHYTKADERGRIFGWMQFEVVGVSGDMLKLEALYSSNMYDCSVDRWSTDIE